jgi:hypothetical protein
MKSEMTATDAEQYPRVFSLARMIYGVSCAMVVYKSLDFAGGYWLNRYWSRGAKPLPWGFSLSSVFYVPNILFVLLMLAVTLLYRPKTELFRWPSPRPAFGLLRSIGLGQLEER